MQTRYRIKEGAVLGSGGHGNVFAAVHVKSGLRLACKIVPLNLYNEDTIDSDGQGQPQKSTVPVTQVFREFQVLKHLDHPNISRLEKVFRTGSNLYIFQELFAGGDLFSYVDAHRHDIGEADAAIVILQITKGIEYLHDRGIVHRDLKPDNILLTSTSGSPRIVITDFGHATRVSRAAEANADERPVKRRRLFSVRGTFEYTAP